MLLDTEVTFSFEMIQYFEHGDNKVNWLYFSPNSLLTLWFTTHSNRNYSCLILVRNWSRPHFISLMTLPFTALFLQQDIATTFNMIFIIWKSCYSKLSFVFVYFKYMSCSLFLPISAGNLQITFLFQKVFCYFQLNIKSTRIHIFTKTLHSISWCYANEFLKYNDLCLFSL